MLQDLRYSLRTLRHNPGFAAVAILTLSLGMGTNAAVFSLIDGILLAPLPYPSPEQLVGVTGTYPSGAFVAVREQIRTADVAAYAEGHAFTLAGDGEPTRVTGSRVSAEFFSVLGVKPLMGRWLRPGEDVAGRDRSVIVSQALWETRFGRDQAIVGRFIQVDGERREIVGVMPASFRFPSSRTAIWVPLGIDSRQTARYWAGDFMPLVGRLRPGVRLPEAHAEIGLIQSRLPPLFPWRMPADWNNNVTVVPLQEALVGSVRPRLLILVAAVALVLTIVCANVANLSLARAATRHRELGIRLAIGAGPRRIAAQLLTESVVLASLGAAVGLLFASEALQILKLVLPPDTPRIESVELNWRVFALTGALAIVTGCVFGLAPVTQALRLRLAAALESGRGGGRTATGPLRIALTIAQVACAVLLVVTAGLLVRGLWTLSHVNPGFESDQVIAATVSPPESICANPDRCLAFYRTLETEVQSTAGVQAAALVNTLPLTGAVAKRSLELQDFKVPPSQAAPLFWLNAITPGYFRVMGMRVESGRVFTADDLSGGPAVAIVSASSARRFWPDQPAVGKTVRFVGEQQWRTIVGVVADVRAYDLTKSVPDFMAGTIYVPHSLRATLEDGRIPADMSVVLRTAMAPVEVAAMLRRIAAGAAGAVVIHDVKPMRARLADAVAAPAATTTLLVTMAGLALVLGCIGVYGVLSFLVSRRIRDFGIRAALGAQPRDLFWLVIKEGATLCTAGIVIGLSGALAVTRWLSSELYGVSATDPITYATVAAAVWAVTLLACYVPTRRAMVVDPIIVLRDM